jgi:GNAT superfamily N-acetyltransferase
MIQRYLPSIGGANWNIKELDKGERNAIKRRLVVGITHSEQEYQAVISYLHMKYADLMDANKDVGNLQWLYSPHRHKTSVFNPVEGKNFDMYAFCIYDPERDMEPVSFGGSYFKKHNAQDSDGPEFQDENGLVTWGHGYVLFVDPDYRRMGLAADQWTMEAKLYRDSHVKWQYDIQNEDSLKVTQSLFADPKSCNIVSMGRLKQDGTHAGIRILMNYYDKELIANWNGLFLNMQDFYHPFDWTFLKREGLSMDQLVKPWKQTE